MKLSLTLFRWNFQQFRAQGNPCWRCFAYAIVFMLDDITVDSALCDDWGDEP